MSKNSQKNYLNNNRKDIEKLIRRNLSASQIAKRLKSAVTRDHVLSFAREDLRLHTSDIEFKLTETLVSNRWDRGLRL